MKRLLTLAFAAVAISPLSFAQTVPVYFSWLEYCGRTQEAGCRLSNITATDLAYVNSAVNQGLRPVNDAPGNDQWTALPASREVDCTGYVVSKRQILLSLGLNPKAMRIVAGAATVEGSESKHVVLEVDVEGRTYTLDNLVRDEIYKPGNAPYPFRVMAVQSHGSVIWSRPD